MLANDLAMALDASLLMRRVGLEPDPWQASLLRSNAQQALLLCTRQAGKSTTTACLALHTALYEPGALILLLSPSLRQSQELFLKVTTFYTELGKPVGEREASALRLTLENGARIIALPGTEATIRGFSGVRLLVIDEAARVADPLYYSVRPMLAVSGGRLVALSTPFGKRGFFHEAWTNGGPTWRRTKIDAYQCPRISRAFLDEERVQMGDWWFRQEYECSFEATLDQVFSYEDVMGAISADVPLLFGGML